MDALRKELESRYEEIKDEIKSIYEVNSHITGWDVPEVDDKEAKRLLMELMQKALDEMKDEVISE